LFSTPAGNGTESNPFRIANLAHLEWVHTYNRNEAVLGIAPGDAHFLLVADINPLEFPIGGGAAATNFIGNFNGGGRTITLNINDTGVGGIGLFRWVGGGGKVHNLNVTGSVTSTTMTTGGVVGSLVGGGIVENVHSSVNVTGTENVGGIAGTVGTNSATPGGIVRNSIATGNVSGTHLVGGIVGNIVAWGGVTTGIVENSAALNPSLTFLGTGIPPFFGRVGNGGTGANNIGFAGMGDVAATFTGGDMTAERRHGASRTAAELQTADGFPVQLTQAPWIHQDGTLPGIGAARPMPAPLYVPTPTPPPDNGDFGNVPPTGIRNVTGLAVAMFVLFMASVGLWMLTPKRNKA
jgi:hypothetical protein